jgi:hypothetical protein
MPTARREHVLHALVSGGFAVVPRDVLFTTVGASFPEALALSPLFDDLPADAHLKDGGAYRFRRHGCFVHDLEADTLTAVPHRAHYQPLTYNALHGGMERWFSPLHPRDERELRVLGARTRARPDLRQRPPSPTILRRGPRVPHRPERGRRQTYPRGRPPRRRRFRRRGARRSGLRPRGETRVFEADGPEWRAFLPRRAVVGALARRHAVVHETTPIVPTGPTPHRDTLVITYREAGFQAP